MPNVYTNIPISIFIITASNQKNSKHLLFIKLYHQNMVSRPLLTSSEGPWARARDRDLGPIGPGPWAQWGPWADWPTRPWAHGAGTRPGPVLI